MPGEDITTLTLDQCKGKQKLLRAKITGCCNRIRRVISGTQSRREAEKLLNEARAHLGETGPLNDRILELLNEEDGVTQHDQFLRYSGAVDGIAEEVTDYLASRADDLPSTNGDPPSQDQLDAYQRVKEKQAAYDEVIQAVEAAKRELEEATETAAAFGGQDEYVDDEQSEASIRSIPVLPKREGSTSAPDDWIEMYCAGTEKFTASTGDHRHSSVRVDLEVYSGRSLEWFEWIGLFHALVHRTGKSPGEKLAILKRNVRGETADMLYGLGGGEAAYKDALRRLKATCGSRPVMRAAHLQALERVEAPKGDPTSFRRYAEKVRTHLFNLSCIGETGHADIIERLAQKLHVYDRLAWNDGRRGGLENRTMNTFGMWLCARASSYQNAYSVAADQYQRTSGPGKPGHQHPQQPAQQFTRRNARTHHGASTSRHEQRSHHQPTDHKSTEEKKDYCFKCEGPHLLLSCTFFKALSVSERLTFTIRRGLCFVCFGVRHGARDCREKRSCGVNGCKLLHHPLLHSDAASRDAKSHHAIGSDASLIAFGVIQLEALSASGEVIPVTVMVDPGSNSTLFREGLARSLKLRGRSQTLRIDGVAGAISTLQSEHLEIRIKTAFGELVTLKGSTLSVVTRPVPFFKWESLRERWRHLDDLPELRPAGGRIDILIGLDHSTLITPTESRIGSEVEPVAEKTRLGWIVKGVINESGGRARVHQALASTDIGVQLLDQMRRFCDTESFGTEHHAECISPANKEAIELLERYTIKLPVGYEVPVIWKDGVRPLLPDNRSLAEARLQGTINKFRRSPPEQQYEYWYRRAMQKNFDEGYALRLTPEEAAAQPAYYLPHFGVPKSPGSSELRLVYDAAAKYQGSCLNDYINSGPALQNPLPAVIIRFREGAVAWSADVGAMYSRIRLNAADRHYHRFLWPEEDGSITTCEMTRVTFGVSCSPFVSIRTMWRAAEDSGPDLKGATEAIRNCFYVDDYLGSARSTEEAVTVTTTVSKALASGDFHLGGWASNDPAVLDAIQPACRVEEKMNGGAQDLGADELETVLGITWRPSSDQLGFRVKEKEVIFTRVGLASMVAGQFDPQGTAAPMTIKGKIRLRELGVRGLDWTESVNEKDREWWAQYFHTMQQLKDVEFPRCLFEDEEDIVRSELHTFADASEEACAAVCYLRNCYKDGRVIVRHVKAATKLAPLKTVSVCKLELTAALLGARLARFVKEALTRKIDAHFYWTDSSTVRNWVRATSAQYQVYVSHRIGEIQTLTEAHEWRFVPGRLNPADAATRSVLEAEAIPGYWLNGPAFLYEDMSCWPKDLPWMAEKEELRSVHAQVADVVVNTDWSAITIMPSELPALIKMEGKFQELLQRCQQEVYPEELKRLKAKKTLRPTSRLMPLTPFLGDDGLLRLGGRLGRAKLPYDVLHPPILPGNHPLARAIIGAFHDSMHHVGTDFVLSHIRQHIWITAGREAVKRVRNECIPCRRFRPKAALQMMADVHQARLGAREPPFTYTSVDYFGPIDVIYGRGTTKRWGALFTCLVTRAVYVDVAISLSSDDFLMVLRRFAAIYRKPAHMFSDNGTNLVGAERILRQELERLKGDDDLTAQLKTLGIHWTFQPAQTPHFGGSHEALVRSVKNALYAALDSEKLGLRKTSDEILRTLLFEVSGLLNSRPLTYVSSDPDDFRPLTPNDFLNRAPVADLPAGEFTRSLPRDHYRYTQRLATLFWDLWHRAFLQSMVGRRKWQTPAKNLAVGDYVLDDWKDAPRGRWRTGRIVRTYPGSDGLVRAVDVKFSTGILRRGANQLALLESSSLDPAGTSSGEYGSAKGTA